MRDWHQAWTAALYGPDGFYRRSAASSGPGPAAHFRTASHAAALPLAAALSRLVPGATAVVDIGAGRGELLTALAATTSLRLHGVDLAGRPQGLPPTVAWHTGLDAVPAAAWDGALVIAWELLDTVPCPVAEVDPAGTPRRVLVADDGTEALGEPLDGADLDWCGRWWPLTAPGRRAEIGATRDAVWADVVRRAVGAVALLAVDYRHTRADRPPLGSLAGYRAGRLVPPVPDGSCDVTAHVALDAVAAAGEAAGATTLALTTQREALRALGLTGRPERFTADALARASAQAELLDPGGLGGFGWLLQAAPGTAAGEPPEWLRTLAP